MLRFRNLFSPRHALFTKPTPRSFAVGDVQGCLGSLQQLLRKVGFNFDRDRLWLAGDLVNRGPQSLETLRFVRNLGERAKIVLGNHDLHLLATACGARKPRRRDTFQDILTAKDRDQLLDWLRQQPLLVSDERLGFVMVHAGIYPQWDLATAAQLASEVESVLRSNAWTEFLRQMYGDQPAAWSASLSGEARLRFIVNCFTRMRLVDASHRLILDYSGSYRERPQGSFGWFEAPQRVDLPLNVVFGHWSTLGKVDLENIYPLDTGCVWGRSLTALELSGDTPQWHRVGCPAIHDGFAAAVPRRSVTKSNA